MKKINKNVKLMTLNKKQLNSCKKIYRQFLETEDLYLEIILKLEKTLAQETGIPDIELFFNDGFVGIGNTSKTMKLIQAEELEAKNAKSKGQRTPMATA